MNYGCCCTDKCAGSWYLRNLARPEFYTIELGPLFWIVYFAVLCWVIGINVVCIDTSFSRNTFHMLNLLARHWFLYHLQNNTNAQRTISIAVPQKGVKFLTNGVTIFNQWISKPIRVCMEINWLWATKYKNDISKIVDNFINSFCSAYMIKLCDTSKHYLYLYVTFYIFRVSWIQSTFIKNFSRSQ